jgi:hypothetical protein
MRNYKCKTENASTSLAVTERAIKLVTDRQGASDFSIKIIAREFNIRYSNLSMFITK